MLALIQRVSEASVTVNGQVTGKIGQGQVILLGIKNGDTAADVAYVANKCANLRIFEDEQGKMNRSALELNGEFLVISQFTLYGDTRRGRRPSFTEAAPPEVAEPLYDKFVTELRQLGLRVETGIFGAMMDVNICNSGPVTIIVASKGEPG